MESVPNPRARAARLHGLAGLLGLGLGGFLARARAPLFPDVLDLSGPDPIRAAATRGAALAAGALLLVAAGSLPSRAPGALLAGAAAGVASALFDPVGGGLLVGTAAPWAVAAPWLILATLAAALSRGPLAPPPPRAPTTPPMGRRHGPSPGAS